MNVEALLGIGGLAVILLAVVGPVAVWLHRRSGPVAGGNGSEVLTRTGLILYGSFALLLVVGAVLAQRFHGLGRLGFAVVYFVGLLALVVVIGGVLEKRGRPLSSGHLTTRSSGP
jgi:hypothetical protein